MDSTRTRRDSSCADRPVQDLVLQPTRSERESFERFRTAVAARIWPRLGLLLAGAALLWWPLDLVLFGNDPHKLTVFAWFRLVLVLVNPVLAYAGHRWGPTASNSVGLIGAIIAVEVGWAAACMSYASHGDPAWFAFFYLAPMFTVLLQATLVWRLVLASVVSATGWVAFHLLPATLPDGALLAASFLLFTTLLAVALGHWHHGLLQTQFLLRRRLDQERAALASLTKELEARVAAQTGDLRALTRRAQRARVEERQRVGRDLHDELGQELAALSLLIETMDGGEPGAEHAAAAPLRSVVTRARGSLRRVLDDLRPRLLDELGMEDAVRELVRERCEAAGLAWTVEVERVDRPVTEALAVAVFRVIQEGLNNVLRHGEARSVHLRLAQEGPLFVLDLHDDGKGFVPGAGVGRGLSIIRERCEALGGEARWRNNGGTSLRATFALGEPE